MSRTAGLIFGAVIVCLAAGAGGGWIGVKIALRHAQPAGLDEVVHRDLELSPAQNAQIAGLERDFDVTKRQRDQEMRAANRDLAEALAGQHVYGPDAARAISRFHAAMGALQTETVEHVLAMRAVLTPQQAAKFDRTVSETLAPPDR